MDRNRGNAEELDVKAPALLMKMVVLLFVILCSASLSLAQEQSAAATNLSQSASAASIEQLKVFVFVQRTDRHAKYSSSEVFQNALNDLLDYLKAKNVAIAVDEFGGRNHAEGATPMETVFNIARDAKASSVLYVVVDRPMTKWIKITAQCFDMKGKQFWQEEASSGGPIWKGLGAQGFQLTTQKLHAQMDKRVGQECLPILAAAKESSAQTR